MYDYEQTQSTTTNDETASTIANLQSRIESLEIAKSFDATQSAVQTERMEFLSTLRSIREAMTTATATGTSGLASSASEKEWKAMKEENERLKVLNEKQKYRIEHLIRSVESLRKEG